MDIDSTVDPELYSMIVFVLGEMQFESMLRAGHISYLGEYCEVRIFLY